MRNGFIVALAACLTGASMTLAQTPPPEVIKTLPAPNVEPLTPIAPIAPVPSMPPAVDAPVADSPFCPQGDCAPCGPRVWGSAEYLLWWIKDAPVPVPLVTTGTAPGFGALGASGTTTLLGGENVGFGPFSGGRFTLGAWLTDDQRFGVEGNYLFLAQQSKQQSVSSSGLPGSTNLSVPFFNTFFGDEESVPLSGNDPFGGGLFGGAATLSLSTKLQGAEFNTLFGLTDPSRPFQLHLLGGARWLSLSENLRFDTSNSFVNFPTVFSTTNDDFGTSNNFYGGQVGLRGDYTWGRFSVQATGKVAFGNMNERVNINGSTTINQFSDVLAPQTFPGGIFAQPSNIGSFHKNTFAYIPEGDLKVSYQITDHIQAFVGYSFLYVSDVVRPGDQIDRNINFTQAVRIIGPDATLIGAAAPVGQTNSTNFWAQGVNFGVEFKF